ncbi:hypothetical protein RchiOBHm_Chr3g0455981 [Rosa chinensis]|uniref:Uncharacterized protein n=1 Tax=Rosa chinensis TaxID=74649 RepID=A0A2P6R799_ROSCH|nr:hypothetical protein RchiOBHm_Chr3g0455981 [Rosa chinensis]
MVSLFLMLWSNFPLGSQLPAGVPTSLPQGVKFEFQTLRVDAKVQDGDSVTVYVSTADPRESSCVLSEVRTDGDHPKIKSSREEELYQGRCTLQKDH